jgi:hypothetical protein
VNCDPNSLSKASSGLRALGDRQLALARLRTLCSWANALTAVTPSSPTNLDVSDTSVAGTTFLTWTNPTPSGSTTEVWKSTDGITYALFTTVAGNLTTAKDTTAMGGNTMWFYKIRACNASCSAFSNIVSVANNFSIDPFGAAISFPNLIKVYGSLSGDTINMASFSAPLLRTVQLNADLANNVNLTTINLNSLATVGSSLFLGSNNLTGAISFPKLVSTGTDFQIQSNPLMTSLSAPLLVSVGHIFQLASCTGMTSVTLTSLQTVADQFLFTSDASLTSLSLPALVSVGNDFDFSFCTALTSASFASLTTLNPQNLYLMNASGNTVLASLSIPVLTNIADGFTFNAPNCALNVASVNLVLHRGVVSGVTATDFELAGGTSAAPAGAGIADKATLIGLGNVCNTN